MPPHTNKSAATAPRVLLKDLAASKHDGGHPRFAVANVVTEPSAHELTMMQARWKPLKEQFEVLARAASRRVPESVTWNWPNKPSLELPASTEVHCLRVDPSAEGGFEGAIMLTLTPLKRLVEPGYAIYINYVESAPWNLEMYVGREGMRYSGVGLNLLRLAIARSVELGCGGALALHSVPETETLSFYRKYGFIDLGFDDEARYQYLELSASGAQELLVGVTE